MSRLSGSEEAATKLQKKIVLVIRQLESLDSMMQKNIRNLSLSDHDNSLDEAEYYCKTLRLFFNKTMPDVLELIKRLDDYISFINGLESSLQTGRTASTILSVTNSPKSHEVWKLTDNGAIYDSPDSIGAGMRKEQPSGCCGLCAIENTTIAAGNAVSLNDLFSLALRHNPPLCSNGGGTTAAERKTILEQLGITSTLEEQSVENIASSVAQGKCVILSVDASKLKPYQTGGNIANFFHQLGFSPHAVLVTSIEVDRDGKITHIIVCDSNAKTLGLTGAVRYTAAEIEKALIKKRKMNVTVIVR